MLVRNLMNMVVLAVVLTGCKHPTTAVTNNVPIPVPIPQEQAQEKAVADLAANFERVHFETDSSKLDRDGKAALDANAVILQAHPDVKVEVQGHADERGTVDYNLALGQRRANAVVDYLASRGVSANRLPVMSYGEERPATTADGATAWAVNRRAEFRILSAPPSIVGTTSN
ncbi:MAG: OmpA family protein [Myxococcota bacterium]